MIWDFTTGIERGESQLMQLVELVSIWNLKPYQLCLYLLFWGANNMVKVFAYFERFSAFLQCCS